MSATVTTHAVHSHAIGLLRCAGLSGIIAMLVAPFLHQWRDSECTLRRHSNAVCLQARSSSMVEHRIASQGWPKYRQSAYLTTRVAKLSCQRGGDVGSARCGRVRLFVEYCTWPTLHLNICEVFTRTFVLLTGSLKEYASGLVRMACTLKTPHEPQSLASQASRQAHLHHAHPRQIRPQMGLPPYR